jgi:hypothetical protein
LRRRRVEKYEENGFADLFARAKDVGGTGDSLSDDYDRKTRALLAKEYGEIVRLFSFDCAKQCLGAVADLLMEKGTLLGGEVRAIMEENPIADSCIATFKMDE